MGKHKHKNIQDIIRESDLEHPGMVAIALARIIIDQHSLGYQPKHLASLISEQRREEGRPVTYAGSKGQTKVAGIADLIASYHKPGDPQLPAAVLARQMIQDHKLDYHYIHLSAMIREWRKETGDVEQVTVQPGKNDDKIRVVNGEYQWKTHFGGMRIPVETVDQIFYEYSRHGLDMSQNQVRKKHDLKIHEWHSLKRALFLYKDANIVSPWTEENTPREQLEKIVEEKMDFKFQDKQLLIEKEYEKNLLKGYNKVIKKDNTQTFALENMLNELADLFAESSSKEYKIARSQPSDGGPGLLVLADLHVGANISSLKINPPFDRDKLRARVLAACEACNQAGFESVTLVLPGDIIESFTGIMHPTQFREVERGMIGANVIKEAVDTIELILASTANVTEILAVSGNHDRYSSSWKEDKNGEVSEIIMYVLERIYGRSVRITRDPRVAVSDALGSVRTIICHGDKKLFASGKDAVLLHGDSSRFNLIVSGHTHHRAVLDDGPNWRWITAPSIVSGNSYAEDLGMASRPGALVIGVDRPTGLPLILDVPVPL